MPTHRLVLDPDTAELLRRLAPLAPLPFYKGEGPNPGSMSGVVRALIHWAADMTTEQDGADCLRSLIAEHRPPDERATQKENDR